MGDFGDDETNAITQFYKVEFMGKCNSCQRNIKRWSILAGHLTCLEHC